MIDYGSLWQVMARADVEHTDGMIALIPSVATAQPYVVPGGEPLEELHVTIQYLSEEILPSLDITQVAALLDDISSRYKPIDARVMGHATFNPDGGPNGDMDPCAVYLVSDSNDLADLAGEIQSTIYVPQAHAPYLCHMTAGYGLRAEQLSTTGPIVFDRLRLAIGGEVNDFAL